MKDAKEYKYGHSEGKYYPDGEFEAQGMFMTMIKCEHPFIQKLIDIKAMVFYQQGEITVIALNGMMLIKIYKDEIYLECVSVPEEFRQQGTGTKLMEALKHASDETNIPVTLRAANVTGMRMTGMPNHMVVQMGIPKKNKIPANKLVQWYEKLGFQKVEKVKKPPSMKMIYFPQNNNAEK